MNGQILEGETHRAAQTALEDKPKIHMLQSYKLMWFKFRVWSCHSCKLGGFKGETETNGSIVCPCSVNGIVGIKPTVGLVSRQGIIPISETQDTAGPMTRTVADAVYMLGSDERQRQARLKKH